MQERPESAIPSKFSALPAALVTGWGGPTETAVSRPPETAEIANDSEANRARPLSHPSTEGLSRPQEQSRGRKNQRRRTAAPTLDQCFDLAAGLLIASKLGWHLNGFLTIWWKAFPIWDGTDEGANTLQRRVFEDAFGWLERGGVPRAAAWTRERVRGRGLHTHCLVHFGWPPVEMTAALLAYLNNKYDVAPDGLHVLLGSPSGAIAGRSRGPSGHATCSRPPATAAKPWT
jgi:hypothetical protein